MLKLAGCSHEAAAFACKTWHYSRSLPAGKLVKIGVWEGGVFIGAVLFGRGANNNIGKRYSLRQVEVCELVRVALKGHDAPVSKIMALAVRLLRKQSPGLRLIVSYADPEQGHHGGIYQACGWLYAGRSGEQRELVVNGRDLHKRSANARWGTASPEKIEKMTGFRVEYGPIRWKHTYLLALDDAMKGQIEPLRQPYPKRARDGEADNGSARTSTDADKATGDRREPRETPPEQAGSEAESRAGAPRAYHRQGC